MPDQQKFGFCRVFLLVKMNQKPSKSAIEGMKKYCTKNCARIYLNPTNKMNIGTQIIDGGERERKRKKQQQEPVEKK